MRFTDVDVDKYSINELRGFEGRRVKRLYQEMGLRFAVSWKGRSYDAGNWDIADTINRAVSAANAALYALTASVVISMIPAPSWFYPYGGIPSPGFRYR